MDPEEQDGLSFVAALTEVITARLGDSLALYPHLADL